VKLKRSHETIAAQSACGWLRLRLYVLLMHRRRARGASLPLFWTIPQDLRAGTHEIHAGWRSANWARETAAETDALSIEIVIINSAAAGMCLSRARGRVWLNNLIPWIYVWLARHNAITIYACNEARPIECIEGPDNATRGRAKFKSSCAPKFII
jgi:hypothetical protein